MSIHTKCFKLEYLMYLPFHQNSHECRTVGRNSDVPLSKETYETLRKSFYLDYRSDEDFTNTAQRCGSIAW